ncbi:MAG: PAS domain S-box protein [Candidatus Hodarchaeota archaeon]
MGSKGHRNLGTSRARIARLINLRSNEISKSWLGALKQKWGEKADLKVRALKKDKKEKKDLLSLLLKILSDKSEIKKQNLEALLYRLGREEFSIFDFFLEISCLEESIGCVLMDSNEIKEAELSDNMDFIHKRLSSLLETVLKETSEIYKYITGSEDRAVCRVNSKGMIIYANEKMKRLLGLKSVTGKCLSSFFKGKEKEFVQKAISGKLGERPGIRPLALIADGHKSTPAGVEIGPIVINHQTRGGYVSMVDLSGPIKAQNEFFDRFGLAIAKVNIKCQITYLNRKARELLGMEKWEGRTLRDLFPDEMNYKIVRAKLESRKKGSSSEYRAEITRLCDKKRVPVMISAMPETELKGNVVGSIAIFRSRFKEEAVEAIHKHIETTRYGQGLLEMAAKEIGRIIPFELFTIAIYSADMRHTRTIFSYAPSGPSGQLKWQRRWWEMSPAARKVLSRKKVIFGDIYDLLGQKQWKYLKDDPDFKKLPNVGYRSFIFYPIMREDRIVGSLSLFEKSQNAFDKTHVKLLQELPVDHVILTALYYEEREELNFRLDLTRKISSASNNILEGAKVVVNELANHYGWQSVSLFRVDEEGRFFSLVRQKAASEAFRFPKDYKFRLDEGILGYVYENRVGVNIGNVNTDAKFKDIFHARVKGIVSQLSLPIIFGDKVLWILNIEDSHQNAFSEDEKKALEAVVAEVGEILQRSWTNHFLNATLQSASDAIIITDNEGNVNRVNPATEKLLRYSRKEMVGRSLKDCIKDEDIAPFILKAEKIPSSEITFRTKDGEEVNVLLSISQLPGEIGGKIFIAKDLSRIKRLEELEYSQKMYYEIATQTKTPLSLVFGWLRKLGKDSENGPMIETLDKAIRQLHQVELSYDRLAFYDSEKGVVPYNELLLDFSEVLDKVLDEFPKTETEKFAIEIEKPMPYLRGDIFQLEFCFKTILSYLLRFLPEENRIRVRVSQDPPWLITEISGFFPGLSKGKYEGITRQRLVSQTLTEMALGEKIIKTFIGNHGGKFYEPKRKREEIEFRIELPLSKYS